MPIKVSCSSCGSVAQLPDDAAGRRGKCRACGSIVQVPSTSRTVKVCVICGTDVTGAKRTKDASGNYFCGPCWTEKLKRIRQRGVVSAPVGAATSTVVSFSPTLEPELSPCEVCNGWFTTGNLRDHGGRILCLDCVQEQSTQPAPLPLRRSGNIPEHVQQIISTNPWLLLAIILGVVVFPLGMPLQGWVAWRLAKALAIVGNERLMWIIGCSLPWLAGLLILKLLVDKAAKEVDAHRPPRKPLSTVEEIEYERLVRLSRIGWGLVMLNVMIAFILTGKWGHADGIIGLVGFGVMITAAVKKRPYLRKLADNGYVKLWFAASNPIADYEKKLTGV
jgi:hypothetical protein